MIGAAVAAAVIAPSTLRALPTRPNFRGAQLPFPGGAVALAVALLALGPLAVFDEVEAVQFLVFFAGVGVLGLMDDLLEGSGRGLRGHARAVLRGEFSTGALKAAGTVSLAFFAMAEITYRDGDLIRGALVLILMTNLFNLLDLRPGRSVKAFVLLGAGLLIAGHSEPIELIGPFAGPLLVLGLFDLRERCMLGDTGANLLGALAGAWVVFAYESTGEWIAVGILVALTIFGEFRSFSATIERLPPLRVLDSLGRKSDA
jgi:UDP-N-acetylmuramyl pentapeptide phosphotransferase/UDP-N-acetylglucosamine-1-phosphate transferase